MPYFNYFQSRNVLYQNDMSITYLYRCYETCKVSTCFTRDSWSNPSLMFSLFYGGVYRPHWWGYIILGLFRWIVYLIWPITEQILGSKVYVQVDRPNFYLFCSFTQKTANNQTQNILYGPDKPTLTSQNTQIHTRRWQIKMLYIRFGWTCVMCKRMSA